jgi:hypothetical protein
MLAHRGFRFARIMLYIDSQQVDILKLENMGSLADENLASQNAAWASPHHPLRQSAYSEAQCAAHDSLDLVNDKAKVLEQMTLYKAKGFPLASAEHGGPGLMDGTWHLRNLRRPNRIIGCAWFVNSSIGATLMIICASTTWCGRCLPTALPTVSSRAIRLSFTRP